MSTCSRDKKNKKFVVATKQTKYWNKLFPKREFTQGFSATTCRTHFVCNGCLSIHIQESSGFIPRNLGKLNGETTRNCGNLCSGGGQTQRWYWTFTLICTSAESCWKIAVGWSLVGDTGHGPQGWADYIQNIFKIGDPTKKSPAGKTHHLQRREVAGNHVEVLRIENGKVQFWVPGQNISTIEINKHRIGNPTFSNRRCIWKQWIELLLC